MADEDAAIDHFGLVGAVIDGKFRVERVVAEGGFGVVYYAMHLALERPIALKVLKTPQELAERAREAFIESFAREAKSIVRINHPNIVQVLDFGIAELPTGRAPWMALEWLSGQTLRDALLVRRGKGGRTRAECYALLRPALEALAYAHEEGIAHRDIKPANMMLVPTRRGEVLKLLDFGIAKVMEEGEEAGTGQTRTSSVLNAFSLMYAAPEQIGGSRTGPWTDVHAMALIITEVLTDSAAYEGVDRTDLCIDVMSSQRPTPAKRRIDAGSWEPVLARALALRPGERYPNAGALLSALDTALAQSPGTLPGPLPLPGVPGAIYAGGTGPYPAVGGETAPQAAWQSGARPAAIDAGTPSHTTLGGATGARAVEPRTEKRGNTKLLVGVGVAALLGIGSAVVVARTQASKGPVGPAASAPTTVATPLPPPVVERPAVPPSVPTTVPAVAAVPAVVPAAVAPQVAVAEAPSVPAQPAPAVVPVAAVPAVTPTAVEPASTAPTTPVAIAEAPVDRTGTGRHGGRHGGRATGTPMARPVAPTPNLGHSTGRSDTRVEAE